MIINENKTEKVIYNHDGIQLNNKEDFAKKVKYFLEEITKKWTIYSSIAAVILTTIAYFRKVSIFRYYNISSDFLSYSVQDIAGIVITNLILFFFAFICPVGLRKLKVSKHEKIIIRFCMYMLCIVYFIIIYAAKIATMFSKNIYIQEFYYYCLCAIIAIALSLTYYNKIINVDKFRDKKYGELVKRACDIGLNIRAFCLIIIIIIMISHFIFTIFAWDLWYKRNYTTITYQNQSYIVLTTTNNSAFVAKYDTEDQSIDCGEYMLVDIKGCKLGEVVFYKPPHILK